MNEFLCNTNSLHKMFLAKQSTPLIRMHSRVKSHTKMHSPCISSLKIPGIHVFQKYLNHTACVRKGAQPPRMRDILSALLILILRRRDASNERTNVPWKAAPARGFEGALLTSHRRRSSRSESTQKQHHVFLCGEELQVQLQGGLRGRRRQRGQHRVQRGPQLPFKARGNLTPGETKPQREEEQLSEQWSEVKLWATFVAWICVSHFSPPKITSNLRFGPPKWFIAALTTFTHPPTSSSLHRLTSVCVEEPVKSCSNFLGQNPPPPRRPRGWKRAAS